LVSVSATDEASDYKTQVGYCSSSFGGGAATTGSTPATTTAVTTGTGPTPAKTASSASGSTPTATHSGSERVMGSMGPVGLTAALAVLYLTFVV